MKKIMTIILCIMSAICTKAEDKSAVSVWVESDNFQAYNISAKPVLKHVDNKLVVHLRNHDMGVYEIHDGMKITFSKECPNGNVNCDEGVTMADANAIVNQFLSNDVKNINVTAADANEDGTITMADANATVNLFLNNE